MGKTALYYEEAQRLFVREGFSLDAIVGMLGKNVSRKTLFNWKKDGEWEEKRRKHLEQNKGTKDQLKALVDVTLRNAEAEPTPKNILALLRAIQAYESYGGIQPLIEESSGEAKKPAQNHYSPELIEMIRGMYGLKS
ncbi:MAG: hypothetical protein AB1805_07545 [Nitrospirota bacterium]